MLKHFKIGGIHPKASKLSSDEKVVVMPLPKRVYIPMSQHIGAPAKPIVAKGDKVVVGQKIGEPVGFISAAVHSSVSGTVVKIENIPDGNNVAKESVVIDVEDDLWQEGIISDCTTIETEHNLSPEQIIALVKECGIVGMGGATFPTHVKLSPPPSAKAEYLVINGVECEPFLTSDDRLMQEHPQEIVIAARSIVTALGAKKAFIGIENNKPNAIKAMMGAAKGEPLVEVVPLKVAYPQGGEKQLIDAVLGKEVPSGALPIATGAVVQNVATIYAIYQAIFQNRPLISRIVNVTGLGVNQQKNIEVRIGTPISEVLEFACGIKEEAAKVISGGPMMGRAICNLEAPIIKGSSALLVMPDSLSHRAPEGPCISCAKCVAACPIGLEPYLMFPYAKKRDYATIESMYIADCIECGCCTYSCPAKIPLLDYIRVAKREVMQIIRERKQ